MPGLRRPSRSPANTPLPPASVDGLPGLAEMVLHRGGRCDLADLADVLGLENDDLMPQVDALDLLGFTSLSGDDLLLTDTDTAFADADVQESKKIFAEAVRHAPPVTLIANSLRQNSGGSLRAGFFRDLLAHHFTTEQVTRQLETATEWGATPSCTPTTPSRRSPTSTRARRTTRTMTSMTSAWP
ncbi:AAA-associated domain-containing protein [Streptomyces sp. NPDC001221]